MALKELEVKYATIRDRDYKLADGGGLYVLVRPNGSKLWRMKYRFDGKEKMLSFGTYPAVSLADARSNAPGPGHCSTTARIPAQGRMHRRRR